MSTITEQVTTEVARLQAAAQIQHDVSNGAVGATVTTEGGQVRTVANAIATLMATVPRGAWGTTTAYAQKDLVTQSNVVYICVVAHTSGTFATDLAAGKWAIFSGPADEGSLASGLGRQRRRGTTAQHASFTGLLGELTIDTDQRMLRLHDGSVAGGIPVSRVNVRNFGARGDGTTDDTTAIAAAWTFCGVLQTVPSGDFSKISKAALVFPAGDYVYNGAGLDNAAGMSITVLGDGKEVTRIRLGATSYLLKPSNVIEQLTVSGIHFYGGKGAIKHTYASANVRGHFDVSQCVFSKYTETAICTLSADMPYWRIFNNVFYGTTTSKGVALGGAADLTEISNNSFLLNQYHVKIANGGNNVKIRGNDFIRFANGGGAPALTDVWIVPNGSAINGGNGCYITGNKFGNENLNAADYRILVADQAAGTDFTDKNHATTLSANFWVGFNVSNNYVGTGGSNVNGLVYSYTPSVYSFIMRDNSFFGGGQTLVKMDALAIAAASYTTENRTEDLGFVDALGIDGASEGYQGPSVTRQGSAIVDDPLGFQQGQSGSVKRYPSGFDPGYLSLLGGDTAAQFLAVPGTTKAATTDAIGGQNALAVTYNYDGASIYYYINTVTPGRRAWLEVELKQAATNPLTRAQLTIQTSGGGQIALKRFVAVQAQWTTYRIPWVPRQSAIGLIVFIGANGWASGSAEQLVVGRVRVYHADEPVSSASLNLGEGNAGYNPPSLANAARTSTTVTVVGAALGDFVQVSFAASLQGIRMWGEVTATDTVTVYFENTTGGTIDLASAKLTARTFRPTR